MVGQELLQLLSNLCATRDAVVVGTVPLDVVAAFVVHSVSSNSSPHLSSGIVVRCPFFGLDLFGPPWKLANGPP